MTEIKKLELKHLCSYLPHEVKFKDLVNNEIYTLDTENLNGVVEDAENINSIRLLLKPMSDLYKPLKDRTYPIAVIGRMYEPNGKLYCEDGVYTYGWNTATGGDDYQGYEIGWIESAGWFGLFFDTYDYENQSENFTGDYIPYNKEIAEYLDKNYFDWRYGLLDQNLAIDINTIEG